MIGLKQADRGAARIKHHRALGVNLSLRPVNDARKIARSAS